MELNKKTIHKIMLIITFTVLLFIGVENIDVVLNILGNIFGLIFPFMLGAVFAFAFNVPMRFYEKKLEHTWLRADKYKKQRRGIGFVLTLLTVLLLIFILLFLIVPQITKTVAQLVEAMPGYNDKIKEWVMELSRRVPQLEEILVEPGYRIPSRVEDGRVPQLEEMLVELQIDWASLAEKGINIFQGSMGNMVGSTFGFITGVVNGVVSFVIAIVFSCYILFQKENLAVQAKQILYAFLPVKRVEKILKICRLSDETFARFLVGQCTEAVILGTMFVISMLILKLPYAMLIGVLIAFLSLIPIVGAFIGCIIGAFLILMVSPIKALIFIILFLVLQQIEGNLIYPHVVGNSVGLPSIWVLFAVTVGGKIMGIPGMILGIPLISVLYVLFAHYIHECLEKKRIPPEKCKEPVKPVPVMKEEKEEHKENKQKRDKQE